MRPNSPIDLVDHGLDGGVVGDVGLEGDDLDAPLLDRCRGLLRAVQIDVGDRHGVDALVGQQQRYLLAEAHLATGARDQCHFALKTEIHWCLPTFALPWWSWLRRASGPELLGNVVESQLQELGLAGLAGRRDPSP